MGKLRKILFLVFSATYIILAPLTVLYALGYIFNPVQQTLIPTGLISMNSHPAGAEVSLNGIPLKDKTPVVLRNLKPGPHEVQVAFEDHHVWRRRIVVEAERALRFENIFLFPLSFRQETLADFSVSKIWHVPGGKYFFVLGEGRRAGDLFFYGLDTEKFQPVFPRMPDEKKSVKSIFLHPEGDRAVIVLQKEDLFQFYFVKLTDPLWVRNLTDFFPQSLFENLQWGREDRNSFFYLEEETLKRFNVERGVLRPVVTKPVLGYTLYEGELFFLDQKRRFLEASEKGKIREVLFEADTKAEFIFGKDPDPYSIFFLPSSFPFAFRESLIVIFLSSKGRLVSNKLPYVLDENVERVSFAESHSRMAYRKNEELWVVDFEEPKKRSFFESGPEPRRIYRGGKTHGPLVWFYEDQYILFLEENWLGVQDFEGGEPILLFEISKKNNDFVLDRDKGFLYFLEPEGNRLSRVKLFEQSWLLPRWREPGDETGKKS